MSELNKSFLTPEAKADINSLLGGGGGGIVVATARTITDRDGKTGGDIVSDMSKDQIVNIIKSDKTVILTIIQIIKDFDYEATGFMRSGFITYDYNARTDSSICSANIGINTYTLSDDNIWVVELNE